MRGPARDHLKKKGKSPLFGAEKSLYKIQDQLLGVAGPLTCLWADLLNKKGQHTGHPSPHPVGVGAPW